jgi:hypothetical protein
MGVKRMSKDEEEFEVLHQQLDSANARADLEMKTWSVPDSSVVRG